MTENFLTKLVSINLVVYNGQKYLWNCLNAIKAQTHQQIEVNILDNASTDETKSIIAREYPEYKVTSSDKNIGMWPGQEKLLTQSRGDYIVVLSVDVILEPDFVEQALKAFARRPDAGALQAKIYQYNISQVLNDSIVLPKTIIDTCGFEIFKSRRIGNIGHGQVDRGQFGNEIEIFAVEGAVPVFQRSALESCRIDGLLIDPDYFWYGDDLDLAWRMRLFGWKQYFIHSLVAHHDRGTTKSQSQHWYDVWKQREQRRAIPLKKRRLDWSNVRFTIIKNDYIINILRDVPYVLAREVSVFIYTLLFEPEVFFEIGRFLRLLPKMLRRRKIVMQKAKVSPPEIHRWFIT